MTAEQLAQLFHETYERLAPQFGYETRKESAKPWADVPEQNKQLMIAVAGELLQHMITTIEQALEWCELYAATVKFLDDVHIYVAGDYLGRGKTLIEAVDKAALELYAQASMDE